MKTTLSRDRRQNYLLKWGDDRHFQWKTRKVLINTPENIKYRQKITNTKTINHNKTWNRTNIVFLCLLHTFFFSLSFLLKHPLSGWKGRGGGFFSSQTLLGTRFPGSDTVFSSFIKNVIKIVLTKTVLRLYRNLYNITYFCWWFINATRIFNWICTHTRVGIKRYMYTIKQNIHRIMIKHKLKQVNYLIELRIQCFKSSVIKIPMFWKIIFPRFWNKLVNRLVRVN